ncbi:MAG: hypothetical protein ACRD32_01090, partial [Nitrososphaerales archaeon]
VSTQSVLSRSLADAIALDDTVSTQSILSRSLADSIALDDTVIADNGIFIRSLADAIALDDQLLTLPTFVRSLADSIALDDTVSTQSVLSRSLADSVALDDQVVADNGIFTRSLADSIALDDTVSTQAVLSRPLDDSIALDGQLSTLPTFVRSLDDSIVLDDQISLQQNLTLTLTDSIALGDQVVAQLVGSQVIISTLASTTSAKFDKSSKQIVTVNSTHAYAFFINSTEDVAYNYTTNGGASWLPTNGLAAGTYGGVAVWYDRWTPGDTGDLIHIATFDVAADKIWYIQFNAATRTASSIVDTVNNPTGCTTDCLGSLSTALGQITDLAITKGINGTIYAGTVDNSLPAASYSVIRKCSVTCTSDANWGNAGNQTNPWLGADNDSHALVMLPLSNSSIMLVSNDIINNLLEYSIYGGPGNWTSWTTIKTNVVDGGDLAHSLSGTVKLSNNALYVSVVNNTNSSNISEVLAFKYASGASSWTQLTSPWNQTQDGASTIIDSSIAIDANSGNLVIAYIIDPDGDAVLTESHINYTISEDDGSTWSTERRVSDVAGFYRGLSIDNINTFQLYATWFDDTNNDFVGDTVIQLRGLTDSITLGDQLSTQSVLSRSLADSVALSDQISVQGGTFTRSLDDSIALDDQVVADNGIFTRSLADSIALADTVSTLPTFVRSLADSIALDDTVSTQSILSRSLADSIALDDTVVADNGIFTRSLADSIALDDTVIADNGIFTRSLAESIALDDQVSALPTFVRSLDDSIALDDAVSTQSVLARPLTDSIVLVDQVVAQLVGSQIIISDYASTTNDRHAKSSKQIVTINSTHAYDFYIDNTANATNGNMLIYNYTTNGGDSWNFGRVLVAVTGSAAADNNTFGAAVWYDKWTPGDNGDLIHIATFDAQSDKIFYVQFDPRTNTNSSKVDTVVATSGCATVCLGGLASANDIAITKGVNGVLYAGIVDATLPSLTGLTSAIRKCSSSCTNDANWSGAGTRTTPWTDAENNDHSTMLLPLANNDIMLVSQNITNNLLQYKTWSDSGQSWDSAWTTIATNVNFNATFQHSLSGTVNPNNNNLYISVVNNTGTGNTSEILAYVYANSWAALTKPWPATTDTTSMLIDSSIGIDSNNGDLYVAYIRTPNGVATNSHVYYSVSRDNGTTWSIDNRISDIPQDYEALSIDGSNGQGLYASWFEDTNNDIEGDMVIRLRGVTDSLVLSDTVSTQSVLSRSLAD